MNRNRRPQVIREQVRQKKLSRAAHALGGSLAGVSIPGWESGEAAREWVRSLWQGSDERRIGAESG